MGTIAMKNCEFNFGSGKSLDCNNSSDDDTAMNNEQRKKLKLENFVKLNLILLKTKILFRSLEIKLFFPIFV